MGAPPDSVGGAFISSWKTARFFSVIDHRSRSSRAPSHAGPSLPGEMGGEESLRNRIAARDALQEHYTCSSAWRNSAALGQRASGFRASALTMARLNDSGTSGLRSAGLVGSDSSCFK
jgi:hypothetical protein